MQGSQYFVVHLSQQAEYKANVFRTQLPEWFKFFDVREMDLSCVYCRNDRKWSKYLRMAWYWLIKPESAHLWTELGNLSRLGCQFVLRFCEVLVISLRKNHHYGKSILRLLKTLSWCLKLEFLGRRTSSGSSRGGEDFIETEKWTRFQNSRESDQQYFWLLWKSRSWGIQGGNLCSL